MGLFTTLLLLSGTAALGVVAFEQSSQLEKRSADGGSPLSSFDTAGWQSQLSGITSNFPVSAEKFGMANTIPGMSSASASSSGSSAEKKKRSADGGSPLSSFDTAGWQSQLTGITSNFPVNAEKFGMANTIPGMSSASASSSGSSAEKKKRSADGGSPLSSFDTAGWQSQLTGITSNFPVNAEKFGMANTIPGMSSASASSSGSSAEKKKRSADGGSPLSSFDTAGWQSQLTGITSNFPVNAEKFGMANTIPGMSSASASSSGSSSEKKKRSADGGSPLSSFDTAGWQSQLTGITSNFPVNAEKFGMANTIPGMSSASASSSGSSAEKKKRSADGGSPLSSFDTAGWQSQLTGITSNFPVNAEKFGMANTIPGMSSASASSSGSSAEKKKRSAEGGSPLSSFDTAGWQSQLTGITSNFPVNAEKFGMANTIPGMSSASASSSGSSAEKKKRSADGGSPLSSFDTAGWQSQLTGITSNFPVNAEKFGMANTIPGMSSASASSSGSSAEKKKRSADGGSPLSSFDTAGWQSQLTGITSNFPVNAEKFGMANTIPGMSSASASSSGSSAEKKKRSADGGSPLSSFDTAGWQSQLTGITSNFPVNAEKFGMANTIPGMSSASASSSGSSAEKKKRSADGGSPLSSFDTAGWQSQLTGITSNFPVNAEKFGMANTIPGMSSASASSSGSSAEKKKRSADGGSPLSSFDTAGWQSQLTGITSNFPVNAEKFGMANTIPGMSSASASSSGSSAEKKKRSSLEDSPSWTDKLKSLFNVGGTS